MLHCVCETTTLLEQTTSAVVRPQAIAATHLQSTLQDALCGTLFIP